MNGIIIASVSSKEQEESGYSLPAQISLLKEYAIRKGISTNEETIYKISETASKKEQRRLFNEMLKTAFKKKINILVFEKVDRVTRNLKDAQAIYEWLEADERRELHCVKDNLVLSRNSKSQEKFLFDIKVALAKNYSDNLSEEVRKGRNQKAQEGRFPGPPKFGYKSIGDKRKNIIPDPIKAPLLQQCFKLFASGNYSLARLVETAYKLGLTNNSGRQIPKSSWHKYLQDPFYYGYFLWEGELYKGVHEPIITKNLFDAIQNILKRKPDAKYNKHFSTFKGVVRCDECDGIISWYEKKGRMYGNCNHYKPCAQRKCGREDELEKKVIEEISDFRLKSERLRDWIRRALVEANQNDLENQQVTHSSLSNELIKTETMLSTLYEDRLSGLITIDTYKAKSAELQIKKDKLTSDIENISNELEEQREINLKIFDLSQHGSIIYYKNEPEERRSLVKLIFKNIKLSSGEYKFVLNKRFEILKKAIDETNSSKVESIEKISFENFEPEKVSSSTTKSGSEQANRLKWLGLVYEVRTVIQFSEEPIYIPKIKERIKV